MLRAHQRDDADLGHPPHRDKPARQPLHGALGERARDRRAAADEDAERAGVVVREVRRAEHVGEKRRRAHRVGDALGVDELHEVNGIPGFLQHEPRAAAERRAACRREIPSGVRASTPCGRRPRGDTPSIRRIGSAPAEIVLAVCITPFGSPVVPEVNISSMTSFGSGRKRPSSGAQRLAVGAAVEKLVPVEEAARHVPRRSRPAWRARGNRRRARRTSRDSRSPGSSPASRPLDFAPGAGCSRSSRWRKIGATGLITAPMRSSASAMMMNSFQLGSCTVTTSPRRMPQSRKPSAAVSALARSSA